MTNINLQKFSVKKKPEGEGEISYQCAFCEKITTLDPPHRAMCKRLSDDLFYCPFCLRHGFHHKSNRDVLILTWRGIFGYLYYSKYAIRGGNLSLSEIGDVIRNHAIVGLKNPVFSYDPESYLWFIDFGRVGIGRKKLDLQDILTTTEEICSVFPVDSTKVYLRFDPAIRKFFSHRYRPDDTKILCPTLSGMIEMPKVFKKEMARNFEPKDLCLRS
jgi:hypothetical protein